MKNQNLKKSKSILASIIAFAIVVFSVVVGVTLFFALSGKLSQKSPIYTPDYKDRITFNAKYDKDGKINENYDPRYLTINEWPYTEVVDSTNGVVEKKYFFNQEGMKVLAQQFYQRGGFSGEMRELNNVNINIPEVKNLSNTSNANGFFVPVYENIYLSISNFIYDSNHQVRKLRYPWTDVPVKTKVELVLPTLVHEYMHHVTNIYAMSAREKDTLSNNDVYENSSGDNYHGHSASLKTTNKKFYTDFYDSLFKLDKILRPRFWDYLSSSFKPIYSSYSAHELFEIANSKQDNESLNWNYLNKFKNNTFNNSMDSAFQYADSVSGSTLNYYFSFDELFAREFLKLSFAPKTALNVAYNNGLNPGFYAYVNGANNVFISSLGDDLMRLMSINKLEQYSFQDNFTYQALDESSARIYGSNWVFPTPYAWWVSRDVDSTEYQLKRQKLLYKAYLDLVGYGLPISQMSIDTTALDVASQSDNYDLSVSRNIKDNELYFNGFLKLKSTDLENKNIDTYIQQFNAQNNNYLVFKDANSDSVTKLPIVLNKGNYRTKKDWDSITQDYGPEWVLGNDYKDYVSYYTTKPYLIDKWNPNKKLEAFFWRDANNDNIIQENEKTYFDYKLAKQRNEAIQRRISTYRQFLWKESRYQTYQLTYSNAFNGLELSKYE
ncbi:MYPU_1760 family metalloprotease [Mycoplasma sp. 128]